MNDTELMQYFIDQTNKRLDNIDRHLERLIGFRYLILGIAMALSSIVSLLINVYGR